MNNEELELLKQTLAVQKKTLKTQQIILGILLIIIVGLVVGCVIVGPKVMNLLKSLEDVLNNIQPTINGLNNFDYDTLNQTMSELKDAIGSLSGVLSIFQ